MFSSHSALYRSVAPALQERLLAAQSHLRALLTEQASLRRARRALEQSQWLPPEGWQALQLEEARSLALHAARRVPYYRELFGRLGVDPLAWRSLDDLHALPELSRDDVIEAGASLLAEGGPWLRFKGSTSGTTGRAMLGWRDRASIAVEQAFVERQAAWAGYRPGERRAWLRGDPVVPAHQSEGPLWRLNRAENMLMLSSYHLSPGNGAAYIEALERFDPVLLQAYPSSISYLARWLEEHDRVYRGPSLRGIVTSSETLSPADRQVITERFGCRVFDWYGAFERVAAIGTCEHGNYHVLEDYGCVEFEPNGDGTANLIGTGFGNRSMPLIRYRADDVVVPADPGYRCPCGRSFRVVERVLGRVDDVIRTPDGRHVVMLDWIFAGLFGLMEAQVVQERLDEVRIRIVAGSEFGFADEQALLARALERLGPRVRIRIERVAQIERTRNGKFRQIVSRLSGEQ
ncbi:capsular polysaccharide biosynthesis protein CapK [Zoogloea ramigera]|uniref:Capsular polysaccharide biosynthesis protein CapK n=1 Tax=Zoogloea ramigera TaxID=350 RepID=A0A4Y4CUT5_ZOORA|nr:phenylacetate--CoA ligase family protein [Zoogloea ramigera]GEC94777.1 capsular polysaccharide biosynthesis protein CapK [Zoogloea ramigera]